MLKYLQIGLAIILAYSNSVSWAAKPVANKPPTVSLTSPVSGASFTTPVTINLSATASDADGTINRVDFYQGSLYIGTSSTSPYGMAWTNVAAGSYSLTAKAVDNLGATTTSSAVSITVTGSKIPISSPINGSTVYGSNITVNGGFTGDANTRVWVSNGNSTRLASINGNNFSANLPVFIGSNVINVSVVHTDKTSDSASITVNGSDYPKIAFTSPTTGIFNAPANVTLAVDAISPGGTINNVSFFKGSTLLSSINAPPYQYVWNSVPGGDFSITAQATDSLGNIATASTAISVLGPNVLPLVNLTAPVSGATFQAPANIPLAANATDSDGSISMVEFYQGGNLIGATNSAPYNLVWTNVPMGSYTITAKATDNRSGTTISAPVSVTVTPPNALPSVSMVSPTDNAQFIFGTNIPLSATASDSDGSINRVEFYQGNTLLGTATTAPYGYIWSNAQIGSYTVTAKAFDNLNALTVSAPIHVAVTPPPPVSITAPANNSNFTAPGPVTITVDTFSATSTIAKIEIFDGTTSLASYVPPGQYNSVKYNFVWYSNTIGSHALTAKVTDAQNAVTISSIVTVQALAPPTVTLKATGNYYLAPAMIDLYATAAPAYGSGATLDKVEIFNGPTLITTLTTSPYYGQWSNVGIGTYTVTAKATDSLGAYVISAPVTLTVGNALSIAATAGLDGSTVSDANIYFSGNIMAPPNSAVTVNGQNATVLANGQFFINAFPLQVGANLIVMKVTAPGGQTSTQNATITRVDAPALFSVSVSPTQGVALPNQPFISKVTIANPNSTAFNSITLACQDPIAGTSVTIATYLCSYANAGTYTIKVTVKDINNAVIYSATRQVSVDLPVDRVAGVRSVYTNMLSRLKAGDSTGALSSFIADAQSTYSDIFAKLGPDLATFAGQLGDINTVTVSDNTAEVVIVRSVNGTLASFSIYLSLDEDGIWRIVSM